MLRISKKKSLYFALVILCCSDIFHCIEWDQLVNQYYPKPCSRSNLFDNSRNGVVGVLPPLVTQADAYMYVRQGQRLLKTMEEIDQAANRERFPSLAMQHFFTSQIPPETRSASAISKANLLGAKIMYNKKSSCGKMTPNTFAAFLESRVFRGAPGRRMTVCHGRGQGGPSLDGSCNNKLRPTWGAAKQPFSRIAPYNYGDGLYSLPVSKSGSPLPSPRLLSSRLLSAPLTQSLLLTAMAVYWGQLLAHDMSNRVMEQHSSGGGIQCCSTDGWRILEGNDLHPACAPIAVPADDSFYSLYGVRYLNFVRSLTTPNGQDALGPAEQLNSVSSFIDCSPIYGYNDALANQLRTFVGGLLRMTATGQLPPAPNASAMCDTSQGYCPCYLTGDTRVNQTPGLTALQTLLAREHNRVANILAALNPHWSDERIYLEARAILRAQVQHITYHEWLPFIMGKRYVERYKITPSGLFSFDYDPNVNAGVINSFATAAFRFFHTLVPGEVMIVSDNGHQNFIRLSDQYLKPCILEHYPNAVESLIKGAVMQSALEADACFSPEVTNFLFKSKNYWGLDLVAMDIQRGRDHGLASYNTFRSICGLRRAETFDDLVGEISLERIAALKQIYENVDDIDLFIGGMLEADIYGSVLGPTFQCIVGEQFFRTRVGDRYFYDVGDMPHSFRTEQLQQLKKASIARLICDNSKNILSIQKRAFESINELNPLFNHNDYNNIPSIDLQYWKEFP